MLPSDKILADGAPAHVYLWLCFASSPTALDAADNLALDTLIILHLKSSICQ